MLRREGFCRGPESPRQQANCPYFFPVEQQPQQVPVGMGVPQQQQWPVVIVSPFKPVVHLPLGYKVKRWCAALTGSKFGTC